MGKVKGIQSIKQREAEASACCLGGEQDEETGQATSRAWMAQQMYLYSGWCMDF